MALRPLDPSIVNAYQAPKFNMPDPLQDVAVLEQIKSGRIARQINEQQLAQLQQDRFALDDMQRKITEAGGPSNLKMAFTEMINSKLPKYAEIGYAGLQKIKEQEDFQSLINRKAPEAPPTPTTLTSPIARPSLEMMPLNAPRKQLATPETDRNNQLAEIAAQQTQPSLPTNMLATDLDQLDRDIQGAYALGTQRSLAYAKALEARRDELNKNIVVSPGATVFQGGKAVYTAPEKAQGQPSLVQEYNFAKTADGGGFKGSYQDFVVARSAAMRTPAQPLAPIPTLDKITGQVVYATREQILQNPRRFVPTSEKQEPRFDASAGGFVYQPTAENPQGKFVAVTGVEGKPLNEAQGNSVAYGIRMKEANSVLEDLAKSGTEKSAIGAGAPYGIGAAVNLLTASPQQQQVQQAKVNFITAILRKESGAAIDQDEFAREDEKYFPQRGDSDAVLAQKKQARKTAIKAMEIQAGPGAKEIQKFSPRVEPTTKSNPAVDDLVKKYGG
jgi:hypothetical protein